MEVLNATVAYQVKLENFPFNIDHEMFELNTNRVSWFIDLDKDTGEKAEIKGYSKEIIDGKDELLAELKVDIDDEKEKPVKINTTLLKNFDKQIEFRLLPDRHEEGISNKYVLIVEGVGRNRYLAGFILPIFNK